MSAVSLNDLLAQASVDPELEAKLAANSGNLKGFLEVANAAGYPVEEEDIMALKTLSDEELSAIAGGFTPYDDKNKCYLATLVDR